MRYCQNRWNRGRRQSSKQLLYSTNSLEQGGTAPPEYQFLLPPHSSYIWHLLSSTMQTLFFLCGTKVICLLNYLVLSLHKHVFLSCPQPGGSFSPQSCGSFSSQPIGSFSPQRCGSFSSQPCGSFTPQPCGSFTPQPCGSFSSQPCGSFSPQPCVLSLSLSHLNHVVLIFLLPESDGSSFLNQMIFCCCLNQMVPSFLKSDGSFLPESDGSFLPESDGSFFSKTRWFLLA